MFAIAFDRIVAKTAENHPNITHKDDLANLFSAFMALKALPWLPDSVRDIRAFKVEHWSDFTGIVKA
jgi:virulence-associated protein VapD